MANSMALWYERWRSTASNGGAAEVEVHLNLWRHLSSCGLESNFLDVGLLFFNTYEIGNIFLFIPTPVAMDKVRDLSEQLCSDTLLSAVFNDVVTVGEVRQSGDYETRRRSSHYLNFASAVAGRDFSAEQISFGGHANGTLLKFNTEFCRRIHEPGHHYVRLRFDLDEVGAKAFSIKRSGGSDFVTSSVVTEEFTELRFNEIRNLPERIAKLIGSAESFGFTITSAHCFLIRDTSFELVASHAPMHKMRRMEANLWKGYLPLTIPEKDLANMIVYHWRSIGDSSGGGVESFVTLARFRRPSDSLLWYVAGIVLLGALGSGLQGSVAGWLAATPGSDFGATLVIAACFAGLVILARPARRLCRGLRARRFRLRQ
jgi:hypothetical protein